jgi:hypothetical protein
MIMSGWIETASPRSRIRSTTPESPPKRRANSESSIAQTVPATMRASARAMRSAIQRGRSIGMKCEQSSELLVGRVRELRGQAIPRR